MFDYALLNEKGDVDIANNFASQANPVAILSLLVERDDDKKRIAELEEREKRVIKLANDSGELCDRVMDALEARSVAITVPDARDDDYDWEGQTPSEAFNTCRMICTLMFRQLLRKAGIKLDVGE